MTQTLDHRIADAFSSDMTSADLTKLLSEVRTAAAEARELNEKSNRIALDPATRPEAVSEARKAGGDATFRAARFDNAVEGLTGLLANAKDRERRASNATEFAAAQTERDELVKDIAAQYPDLSARLTALLTRIAANNSRIEAANRLALGTIERAEHAARPGGQSNAYGAHNLPVRQLVDYVRLPAVEMAHAVPDQWPAYNNW